MQINCVRSGKIELYEDESYLLEIKSNKITINATTDLGALHALETLLQLLQNNSNSYYFPMSKISDFPRFTWRGLMIDVARHFHACRCYKKKFGWNGSCKNECFSLAFSR